MNQYSQTLDVEQAIRLRRTVKPEKMNGRRIDDDSVRELLALADWAPTHAKTEPWRFIVYGDEQVRIFTNRHAEIFKENTAPPGFTQQKYDNLVRLGDNVSHIIVVWMKRIPSHKIPEMEEVAATSAAIENILLAATSRGISTFWSTGGMTLHGALHKEFGLNDEDKILGLLYLGYSDEPFREGSRLIPLSEKIQWIR